MRKTREILRQKRVIDLLRSNPHPLPRVELRQRLRVNNQRLGDALDQLQRRGFLARVPRGWQLDPAASPGETESGSAETQPAEG